MTKWETVVKEYGDPQTYINHLRELAQQDDMRVTDVQEALRDINFIRREGGKAELSTVQLADLLV